MLVLRDVTRSLGRDPILARTNLDFPDDTPTAVLGLSASQRDAFLKLLAGADKPQKGSVRLAGEDIAQARRDRRRIVRIGPGGEKVSGQRVGKLIGQDAASRVRLRFEDRAITIEDDGPGVPDAELERIRERGRRLDETKQGSGLGLSIVEDIADIYGLQLIYGRSELGGLKVTVRL